MEHLGLPHWTLGARREGSTLEFSLGDGRRLAWRSSREWATVQPPMSLASVADVVGAELACRLVDSGSRPLTILYDGIKDSALDAIPWEHLGLEGATLATHFALARQLASDCELEPTPATPQADNLEARLLQATATQTEGPVPAIAYDALEQPWAQEAAASAHVLLLDRVSIQSFMERVPGPRRRRLLVTRDVVPLRSLAAALDASAAVLFLPVAERFDPESVKALLVQLGSGRSVGEATRWLHCRAAPDLPAVRLYGDPEMRFVRAQVPTLRRHITSLCFDLVGSTVLIAERGDEAYAEVLSRLHSRCTAIVRHHGGTPEDPQGNDGVMNYFGHPVAVEDAAVRAVNAGFAILQAVAELGVEVRVGIATGPAAVKSGQPVGMSIHLAARLQQVALPGTVLVSDATQRLVAQAFDLEALTPPPVLKGIHPPEPAYRVLGPRGDGVEHCAESRAALTPMVGRRAELARLKECWQASRDHGTQLALVLGEAGIGKSRLVREFRQELVRAGAQVLECRCRAEACTSAFLALAEAMRRWLEIGPDAPPDQALDKLAAAAPGLVAEGESLAILSAWLGLAAPVPQYRQDSPRQRLLGLLVDWFLACACERPLCLVVEDWHWADPSLREVVSQLAERSGGPGLLVVVTLRSEARAPAFPGPHQRIELAGLQAEAARDLVAQVCEGSPLSPGLVAQLAARGGGVPLFLEETARMALELGAHGTGRELEALKDVPATLHYLLAARLDALPAAKQVAQVAAVLGRQFPRDLLAAVIEDAGLALDAAALDERLAQLVGSGLVHAEEAGHYAFRHALIRDAAYTSLWKRDQLKLHGSVVRLLKERWTELVAQHPELLALHQFEAGLDADAVVHWEQAARLATAQSAEQEATSHLRSALAALARTAPGVERDRTALRLQLLLAARLLATEGYGADAVLQAYVDAEQLCRRIGDDTARFKVEMGLEAYRFMRADFAQALEHGHRAATMAVQSGDDRQRLHAHWGLACTLFHQGELLATMREMETGLALYTPALRGQFGIQDPGVMCMAYSSWGLWELGHPDTALARIEHAVAMADASRHRFSQAAVMSYAVSIQLLRGETGAALERAIACARLCEDHGFPVWLAITRCMRGYLLCERGDFDTGLREMKASYAQWLATGARVSQPLYLALQVEGLLLAGQLAEAEARVHDGLGIIGQCGERQLEAELMRLRGELALRRGDTAEGEAWLKRAYALALRRHSVGFALRSATALARLWAGCGRQERARRLLQPLAARWQEGRETRDLRTAAEVIDRLH